MLRILANLLECGIFHHGFMESSLEGHDFSIYLNCFCICYEPGGGWRPKPVSSVTQLTSSKSNSIWLMFASPFLCIQSALPLLSPFCPQLLDFFVFLLRMEMRFLKSESISGCVDVPFTWIICIRSTDRFKSFSLSLVRSSAFSLRLASFAACSSSIFSSFSSSSDRDKNTVI